MSRTQRRRPVGEPGAFVESQALGLSGRRRRLSVGSVSAVAVTMLAYMVDLLVPSLGGSSLFAGVHRIRVFNRAFVRIQSPGVVGYRTQRPGYSNVYDLLQ